MKALFSGSLLFAILFSVSLTIGCNKEKQTAKKDYPIIPVPFTSVQVNDQFWAPRLKINHEVTIPIALDQCYKTGRVNNFLFAARIRQGNFCTQFPFDDSDIYKIIEGASYSLQTFPDSLLEARIDTLIYYIGKAQEPDGYLYTNRTIDSTHLHPWAGKKRWEGDPTGSHELYNLGHLYEAAVAHYQATGKRTLLDIAIKSADLLVKDFGPGKLAYEPGHQVVEMGLVKMYRVTGKKEYLDLAKYFLDIRGKGTEYSQDHIKVTEQTKAVGHAVRAMYMYSGMADVAAMTGDSSYVKALDKIWSDLISTKFYITGGIGAEAGHEGFGPAYELPNLTAYNETCASIGEVYWNSRMFLLKGESSYYDVLERVLYNGLISGISLSGDHFFYPNPLESDGKYERSEWFGCACCPSNLCRFIPSVPGYVYAHTTDRIYVNLFIGSNAEIELDGNTVNIEQKTSYPWDGKVDFEISPEESEKLELALRIPGWARNQPVPGNLYEFTSPDSSKIELTVNGSPVKYVIQKGYAIVARRWKTGDVLSLTLPMPVRYVRANSQVIADAGRVAIERGPLVYCAESADYPDGKIPEIISSQNMKPEFVPGVLSGISEIKTNEFTAIPYYAWANRGPQKMMVWFKQ
ncbi:MAG TPA: glycoside hydrolase family 127 protein [Bacteroidales bacterium]|nr:glycoside hydrolase family 127 protein [Bacteroidales bacterium]